MIAALDSATPPTSVQVAAAKAAGVTVWSGYLATRPNVHLYRPWSRAEFAIVKALPGVPIAFYSGADDPATVRALATLWGVRPCLDVEGGIRPDGPWVQGNLDVVGGGLYGSRAVHSGRRAAFHIASFYPWPQVDPRASWPPGWPQPTTPCGWQWQNTHNEFGASVDRSWLDDSFASGGSMTPDQERQLLAEVGDLHAAVARVEVALGTAKADGSGPAPTQPAPGFIQSATASLDALKTGGGKLAPFDAAIIPK